MRLLLFALLVACSSATPAELVPAPHVAPPRWCVQALLGDGEQTTLCSETPRTCERARMVANLWGRRYADVVALSGCFARPGVR